MTGKTDRVDLIETFLAAAELGSLSAAATKLGTTQPTVSRRLRDLEELIGANLAIRTTHKFCLTQEGEELHRRAIGWTDAWTEWTDTLRSGASPAKGKLKVIGPAAYGPSFLIHAVKAYRSAYPNMEVELRLTERLIDLAREGVDCWIRVGGVQDQSLHVRSIGTMHRFLICSPEFARGRTIHTPADLVHQPFVGVRVGLAPLLSDKLALHDEHGNQKIIPILTPVSTDCLMTSYQGVTAGMGIGISAPWMCTADIKAGRIQRVLPDWEAEAVHIEVATVAGRFRPNRIRDFVDIFEHTMRQVDGFTPNRPAPATGAPAI